MISILLLTGARFAAAGGSPTEVPDITSPGKVLPLPRSVDQLGGRTVLLREGENGVAPLIDTSAAIRALFDRLLAFRLSELGADQTADGYAVPVKFERMPGILPSGESAVPVNFKEQGYLLEVSSGGVYCQAETETGLVNGFATLLQLLHFADGEVTVSNCRVTDWPEYTTRYVTEYHIPDTGYFDWMALYKINGFATSYRAFKWDDPGERTIRALIALGGYVEELGTIKHMVQMHIGGRGGSVLDVGNEDHIAALLESITLVIERGRASHIMLCHDDIAPVLKGREIGRFESPAHAHIYLLERIEEFLEDKYPGVGLSFVTPYYRGFHHRSWRNLKTMPKAFAYMRALRAWQTSKTAIVWTGPNTESFTITGADIWSYRRLVGGDKNLIYWDNTWHTNQPLRSFRAEYPDEFADDCFDRIALVNIYATRPIGKFFSATAMDYYWNPGGFDPLRSRRTAVARFIGPAAVVIAEEFYEYRGSSYYSSFSKNADIDYLHDIFSRMLEVSRDGRLPEYCLKEVAKIEAAE